MSEVAKFFNTTNSHIWQCVKLGDSFSVFKERYIMADCTREFPENTSDILSSNRNGGVAKKVIISHIGSNKSEILDSAAEVLRKYPDITKKQLYIALKENRVKSMLERLCSMLNKKTVW